MTSFQVAYLDGFYRVYLTRTGIDRAYVGPRFLTPSEANDYADRLAATPRISPLRAAPDKEDSGTAPSGERSGRPGGTTE